MDWKFGMITCKRSQNEQFPTLAICRFGFHWKPLFKSIDRNECAIQLVLERGANPFPPKCDRLDSPLDHAVREGSVNVVKYMLDANDRKNIPVGDTRDELFYAKYKAHMPTPRLKENVVAISLMSGL